VDGSGAEASGLVRAVQVFLLRTSGRYDQGSRERLGAHAANLPKLSGEANRLACPARFPDAVSSTHVVWRPPRKIQGADHLYFSNCKFAVFWEKYHACIAIRPFFTINCENVSIRAKISMKKFKLPKEIKKAATLLEKIVAERMRGEHRKDAEFRALIVGTEIGDLHKYITHDKKLNPKARPHGPKEDEILAYGQALIQLVALAFLRKIPISKALELAIKNWQDRDWKIKKALVSEGFLRGVTAFPGKVEGEVFLADDTSIISFPGNLILVASCLKPDHFPILIANKPLAIVTDHGGMTSHGAIIARELGIVCVVGTGEATKKVSHGSKIKVEARKNGKAKIILIQSS